MSIQNNISHNFEGLSLWIHFTNNSGASAADIAMVQHHIDYAMPLLDRYIETFRKYTLHNEQHQRNIVKIMGELLGSHVKKLTALESAMLLLSAVYHDLGMVYSENELSVICSEPRFQNFLQENPRAMLEYELNDRQINDGLTEWYCRSMHAERVWVYLNKINSKTPLKWGNASIKEGLGHLCESHNFSVEKIISELPNFKSQYLGHCDLIFCSILLRLADIFDFDNTRSPKSVYEFLDLDNPKNKLDAFSKLEWEKHLNSNGFVFDWGISDDKLKAVFSATTPHPNIEVAMRSFIATINSELASCHKLQRFCSSKWIDHPLPEEVDVQNLTAENYQSGDYHFSLSEDKILDLLTGDGLYNDEFIFIRELLQNAIDTSRHREFYETQTNSSFKVSPINVSFFKDGMGYQWIRIDDFGMGMNEDIIANHLLKKGDSYYNSDKFKLDKIKINKELAKDFVPISRFGIGLLSCFMAGDRIEINTKHISSHAESFRLGIKGRNAHYILQSQKKHHAPLPMPSQYNTKEGYRNESGTSIAVRITTSKEFWGFDLKHELEKFIICSPIPILFEGNEIGGNHGSALDKPWVEDETVSIDSAFVEKVENTFGIKFEKGIDIIIENIDITKRSFNSNLKGQLNFLAINAKYENLGVYRDIYFVLELYNEVFTLKVCGTKKGEKGNLEKIEVHEAHDINFLLDKLKIPNDLHNNELGNREFLIRNNMLLSHNGIVLNDSRRVFALDMDRINSQYAKSNHNNSSFIYFGILYFQDELLPDLTVSRNDIKGLSFDLLSNLSFSLKPLNKYLNDSSPDFTFFSRYGRFSDYTSAEIEKSGFYSKNKLYLDNYINLEVDGKKCSIEELKKDTFKEKQFHHNHYRSSFYDYLVNYVIEQNFNITIKIAENGCTCKFFISSPSVAFPKALQGFLPLTFVNFGKDQRLVFGEKMNVNHPFVQWYIGAVTNLDADYSYYSKQLIYTLFNNNSKTAFESCSNILERLNIILPEELKPYRTFTLKQSDLP